MRLDNVRVTLDKNKIGWLGVVVFVSENRQGTGTPVNFCLAGVTDQASTARLE